MKGKLQTRRSSYSKRRDSFQGHYFFFDKITGSTQTRPVLGFPCHKTGQHPILVPILRYNLSNKEEITNQHN